MPFARHFDGSRFYNPNGARERGFLDVLRWKLTSRQEPSPRFVSDVRQSVPPRRVENRELLATMVNHSTVLLQQSASNILTDPIWSERTGPTSLVGPRRHRIPGVRKEDLPDIDLVLISHNHYDHLDLPTLHWLSGRGRINAMSFRSGVGKLLRSEKIGPVHEMDWGEVRTFGETTITSVPAYHFSSRGILDRNKTLWCGYAISCGNGIVYFAGDTAFGDHFSQIREAFGSPRLSLLPIGAYEPRWFMSPVHMAPEQALEAHRILGSASSLAIHHGTFQLADESLDAPKRQILKSSPPDSFLLLANGQSAGVA